MTYDEWMAEGKRRFGEDFLNWRFECPICHHVVAVRDYQQYKDKGADPNSATCECIGRYIPGSRKAFENGGRKTGPCDYAGYGLFRLSPVHITDMPGAQPGKIMHCFAFADTE